MSALRSTHKPLDPLPEGWSEFKAPTGHSYYYNSSTGKSTYVRPTVVAIQPEPQVNPLDQFNLQFGSNGAAHGQWSAAAGLDSQPFRGGGPDHRRQEPKDRPKSKKPIPGAKPWLLVYTKLGRRFVHNPDSNESLWKFPSDVMKCIVELDRKERERRERRERGEPSDSEPEAKDASGDEKSYDSDEYEEVEVTDDEDDAVSKRPRLEEPNQPPGPRELNEDDIAYQLAAMEEDGYEEGWDDYEEPQLDEEDAKGLFFDLLDDNRINPFTPWDSVVEAGTIIDDERYLCLPNMKSRREAFEEWSSDRIQKAKEAKAKQEKKDPKIAYLALLEKHATPKLYWPEFKRKFRKEPEMRDAKLSDKDREKLYREHISRLKSPENTLKSDLTTLLKSISLRDLNRSTDMTMLPSKLLTDVRYISLPTSVRNPLIEGYISMQPDAPNVEESPEEEDRLAKLRLERERREKALKDRERKVDEEKRRRERMLMASRADAKAAELELNEAMKFGKRGLLSHKEDIGES